MWHYFFTFFILAALVAPLNPMVAMAAGDEEIPVAHQTLSGGFVYGAPLHTIMWGQGVDRAPRKAPVGQAPQTRKEPVGQAPQNGLPADLLEWTQRLVPPHLRPNPARFTPSIQQAVRPAGHSSQRRPAGSGQAPASYDEPFTPATTASSYIPPFTPATTASSYSAPFTPATTASFAREIRAVDKEMEDFQTQLNALNAAVDGGWRPHIDQDVLDTLLTEVDALQKVSSMTDPRAQSFGAQMQGVHPRNPSSHSFQTASHMPIPSHDRMPMASEDRTAHSSSSRQFTFEELPLGGINWESGEGTDELDALFRAPDDSAQMLNHTADLDTMGMAVDALISRDAHVVIPAAVKPAAAVMAQQAAASYNPLSSPVASIVSSDEGPDFNSGDVDLFNGKARSKKASKGSKKLSRKDKPYKRPAQAVADTETDTVAPSKRKKTLKVRASSTPKQGRPKKHDTHAQGEKARRVRQEEALSQLAGLAETNSDVNERYQAILQKVERDADVLAASLAEEIEAARQRRDSKAAKKLQECIRRKRIALSPLSTLYRQLVREGVIAKSLL